MKIKTGDNVQVISGKERGKTGKVMQVLVSEGTVVVEKLNQRVKHVAARGNTKGQKIEFSAPLKRENVMLVCPKCSKITRVGYVVLADGKKVRRCAKCKEQFA